MKLSIIIASWNTCDLLAACLQSICRSSSPQTLLSSETFVVDNASTDGSTSMVRRDYPWVRLLENSNNVGFARANNQAIEESCGQYLLLLNPDTELRPGALEALVRFTDGCPRAGAVGPQLLNPDGSLQPSCSLAPTLSREFWRLLHLDVLYPYGSYRMTRWPLDNPRPVDVVQGACLLMRRDVIEQIGVLDAGYFMYTEEVDLCCQIRKANMSIYWVPESQVIHHGAQSTRQVASQMFLNLYRSKVRFFRKNHGPWRARSYKLILALISALRLLCVPLVWLEGETNRQRHLTLAGNYSRLLLNLPQM